MEGFCVSKMNNEALTNESLPLDYACHLCMSPSTLILEILFLNINKKRVSFTASLFTNNFKQILKHKFTLKNSVLYLCLSYFCGFSFAIQAVFTNPLECHSLGVCKCREQMNRRFSSQLTDYILTGHKVGSTAQRWCMKSIVFVNTANLTVEVISLTAHRVLVL